MTMRSDVYELNHTIKQQHWWFTSRRLIFRSLLQLCLPPDQSKVITDIGCGTGSSISSLSDLYTCRGIDLSPEAIRMAQERYPDVEFHCGSIPEDIPDIAQETDCFILADILEHIEDDATLLSRLWEISRPGTYFLITVPADMNLWSIHDETHSHFRRYNIEQFEQL